ncbi:MAG: hypothetical protein MW690_000003 [Methanophagales archaeon]|nr:hypothetical protein [Methanophagales archaeon]
MPLLTFCLNQWMISRWHRTLSPALTLSSAKKGVLRAVDASMPFRLVFSPRFFVMSASVVSEPSLGISIFIPSRHDFSTLNASSGGISKIFTRTFVRQRLTSASSSNCLRRSPYENRLSILVLSPLLTLFRVCNSIDAEPFNLSAHYQAPLKISHAKRNPFQISRLA